ncbi:MAG: CoA transferase [Chloroflexi bacterium]|nr:CoA transferase [Chloroflexota bacterium]
MEVPGNDLTPIASALGQITGQPLDRHALSGVRVIDFSWIGVGPLTALYLAHHGAEVVRIESDTRHDLVRSEGPFRNNEVGINLSGMYEDNNTNKLGVTLNLNHPQAVEIARRLVMIGDVVVESFTPRAMKKWGLDYAALRQVRPDIIMVSLTGQGQTGPHNMHPLAGIILPGLAGLYHLTGWPDRAPIELGMPYSDWVAPHFGALAVLTALDHRRRTGCGQHIDVSQVETVIHALETAVLDYTANGRVQARTGNRHPSFAPHGVYRCKGWERWVAIAITRDEEWESLRGALGHPAWAGAACFATFRERHRHHAELDQHIEQWTSQYPPEQVMALLQAAGVPCGLVANAQDMHQDPQLAHRHHYWFLEHPEMGRVAHNSPSFILSGTPRELRHHSPMMGQHNEQVFKEMLGLSEESFVEALLSGALE